MPMLHQNWTKGPLSFFYNQDTLTEIAMAKRMDTDLTLSYNQLPAVRNKKIHNSATENGF